MGCLRGGWDATCDQRDCFVVPSRRDVRVEQNRGGLTRGDPVAGNSFDERTSQVKQVESLFRCTMAIFNFPTVVLNSALHMKRVPRMRLQKR